MTRTELTATIRKDAGKGPARRLRAKEQIPAVLYGRGEVPLNIAIDPLALKAAIATPTRLNTIITLKLDNGSERTVLLKDYQTDIIKHDLMHADFLDVRLDEKVKVKIPLIYTGIPVASPTAASCRPCAASSRWSACPRTSPRRSRSTSWPSRSAARCTSRT